MGKRSCPFSDYLVTRETPSVTREVHDKLRIWQTTAAFFFFPFCSSALVCKKNQTKTQCSLQRSWQGINWNLWDSAVQICAKQKVFGLMYATISARFIFPPSLLLMPAQSVSSIRSRFCPHLAEMWRCTVRPWPCKIIFSFHPGKQTATAFCGQVNLVQYEQGWRAGWARPTDGDRCCSTDWYLLSRTFPALESQQELHCLVIPSGASPLLAEQRKPSEQSNGSPPAVKRAFEPDLA